MISFTSQAVNGFELEGEAAYPDGYRGHSILVFVFLAYSSLYSKTFSKTILNRLRAPRLLNQHSFKLYGCHSIECITHAGHSIAFNVFALCDLDI